MGMLQIQGFRFWDLGPTTGCRHPGIAWPLRRWTSWCRQQALAWRGLEPPPKHDTVICDYNITISWTHQDPMSRNTLCEHSPASTRVSLTSHNYETRSYNAVTILKFETKTKVSSTHDFPLNSIHNTGIRLQLKGCGAAAWTLPVPSDGPWLAPLPDIAVESDPIALI